MKNGFEKGWAKLEEGRTSKRLIQARDDRL